MLKHQKPKSPPCLRLPGLVGLLLVLFALGYPGLILTQEAPKQDMAADSKEADRKESTQLPEKLPWDEPEIVGDEGESVEVILEEGEWIVVGERLEGIRTQDARPYQVPARKVEDVPMYPCNDCHGKRQVADLRVRVLEKDHTNINVRHGGKWFWCTDCHDTKNMDGLRSIRNKHIDMDLGYLLCGQCHFRQLRDWQQGGHGKRIGFWKGERVLRTCTECHNAHSPAFEPIKPAPPPLVRTGLVREEGTKEAHYNGWRIQVEVVEDKK